MNNTEISVKHEPYKVLKIEKVVDEAKDIKTFILRHNLQAKPGQFVLVWIPRIDEKPFSISFQDNERIGITVFGIGPFTKKFNRLSTGDKIGIKGPYGNPFSIEGENIVLVGGGCGSASLAFLADELKKAGKNITFIIGAKSKQHVLYEERMKISDIKTIITTDDGSTGIKGFTTDVLLDLIKEKGNIDMVYTCGPELMMKKVLEICSKNNIPAQFSLERYMKCGIGICGQCCVDDTGIRVCKEGPVLTKDQVNKIKEFGKYHRDASGAKIDFAKKCT